MAMGEYNRVVQEELNMNITDQYISVAMINEHLEPIPQFPLPSGYTIRWYHDGDETLWLDVQRASEDHLEITHELFMEWHGDYLSILKDRMFFLFNAEMNAIGTATAWFLDDYNGKPYGRVGWVAIVSHMRDKGLSRPVMSISLIDSASTSTQRADESAVTAARTASRKLGALAKKICSSKRKMIKPG